jgi:DNA polymerase (family 10)
MTNKEIAQTFQLLSNLMELHDGDPFRIKSYQFVYQTIRNLDVSLVDLPQSELAKIKGIGKSISLQIVELFSTGSLTGLNNLLEITPPGIIKLLKIKVKVKYPLCLSFLPLIKAKTKVLKESI